MEQLFDLGELENTVKRRFRDSDVFEARLMGAVFKGESRPKNCSAFFSPQDFSKLEKALLNVEYYDNFWFSLNPVKKNIKNRAPCVFKKKRDKPIQAINDDIDRYRFLYLDFDVIKPLEHKENCTTETEKRAAYNTVHECIEFMKDNGFPDPLEITDSGNGFHVLYQCDLPTSYAGAVRKFQKALKYRFANEHVKIDDGVFNAARMIRPPGSKNQKGKNLPNRPHRNAKLIEENIPIEVTKSLLEEFIAKGDWIDKIESSRVSNKCDLGIEEIIKKSGVDVVNLSNPAKCGSALIYRIKECPFCKNNDTSSYICKFDEGFSYNCFHESCTAKTSTFSKKFKISLNQVKGSSDDPKLLVDIFSGYRYDGQLDLKLPPNYSFEDGVLKVLDGKSSREVVSQPIYIGAIMEDVDTGTEYAQLSFVRYRRWRHYIVAKKDLLNRQRLIDFAEFGLSVGSDNATQLTNYLRCFDLTNEKSMKHARASSRMGWQNIDGKTGFLWGQRYITKEGMGSNVNLADTQAKSWPDNCIAFRGSSDGEQQLAECLQSNGSYNDWQSAMGWAVKHPNLLTMVLGAFSSPLLDVLNQNNFLMDFCNRTSSGKTTGVAFAASIWGNPDKSSSGSIIKSWDSTRTNIERSAFGRNHLPLFMDDTKAAKDTDELSSVVYSLCNGQGRGRGTITGTARDKNFKTIIISTGEDSITDFSQAGGIMARVLQVSGPMFTKSGKEFGFQIAENMEMILDNYGFAGPLFVSYLMENEDKWHQWCVDHRERAKKFTTRNENILMRLANSMSVLSICADLLRDAGILDVPAEKVDEAIKSIWEKCRDNADGSDREKSALYAVCQYLEVNQDRVLVVEDGRPADYENTLAADTGSVFAPKNPRSAIARIEAAKGQMIRLCVNNGVVEKVLKINGYSAKAIKSQWADRGWLETRNDKRGSPTKPVRLGKKSSVSCVVVNKEGCSKLHLYNEEVESQSPRAVLDRAKKTIGSDEDEWHSDNEASLW